MVIMFYLSRNALWLYSAIARQSITDASAVWGNKVNQNSVFDKLSGVYRSTCVIATGAMWTSPGAALNAMLSLPPLHIFVQPGEGMHAQGVNNKENIMATISISSRLNPELSITWYDAPK